MGEDAVPPQPVLAFGCWVSRRGVAAGKRKPVIIWQESPGLMYILAHREDCAFFPVLCFLLLRCIHAGGKKISTR